MGITYNICWWTNCCRRNIERGRYSTLDNGTNTVGFTALPGGERVWSDGGFAELGTDSYHWTSTEDEYLSTNGWGQGMTTTTIATVKGGYPKVAGASVRCLKN